MKMGLAAMMTPRMPKTMKTRRRRLEKVLGIWRSTKSTSLANLRFYGMRWYAMDFMVCVLRTEVTTATIGPWPTGPRLNFTTPGKVHEYLFKVSFGIESTLKFPKSACCEHNRKKKCTYWWSCPLDSCQRTTLALWGCCPACCRGVWMMRWGRRWWRSGIEASQLQRSQRLGLCNYEFSGENN